MATTLDEFNDFDPTSSVLLLGSGFSLEGINLFGTAPPNGPGLRRHFLERLHLPSDNTYELQVLAEEFAGTNQLGLYHELYNLFHIATVGPNQTAIMREPWLRVYTTNYDDTVEVAWHALQKPNAIFTNTDPLPNRLPTNSIVHLHGSVGRLTEDTVLEQLVLGESAYVRQHLARSPWYTQFQGDIRYASNVFIVGYSLSDYHISALLLENPSLATRTFFIQPPGRDEIFLRRTSTYGDTFFIGIEGFAKAIAELPRPMPLTDLTKLRSLRYLDPLRDRKSLRPPTAIEVLNLLVFGTFNYSRCAATIPTETYVISRNDPLNDALDKLNSSKSIIIDSRLGNGKTIFLYLLFLAAAARGYNCFLYKGTGPNLEQELIALKSLDKLIIIFDEYTSAQDVIGTVTEALPKAKLIVEIRSSIFEVRYHEVSQAIPKPYTRVSLNRLSSSDIAAFRRLCDSAGITLPRIRSRQPVPELREILLELLDSSNIKQKIDTSIRPLFNNAAKRKVLLLTTMLSKFHLSAPPGFIRSVTGVDPYHEFRPIKEISDELFDTDAEEFRIRSTVFAEFAVRQFLTISEITDSIVDTALAAASRKTDRAYRVLMSSLLQYSNLLELFDREVNANEVIRHVYERLRYDERINDEPLFWLQYAIAMAEADELQIAEQFIRTSYERAARRTGFRTFQIDTQALRILLLIETKEKTRGPVVRLQQILEKLELINSMLGEESHRTYAIRVLEFVGPFVEKRRHDLSLPEGTALTFWLTKVSETLGSLPLEYRARAGTDSSKVKLDLARQLLL